MEENIIGKRAYKKSGFYAGLIGIIDSKDKIFDSYLIKFKDGSGVYASINDMVILEDSDTETIKNIKIK